MPLEQSFKFWNKNLIIFIVLWALAVYFYFPDPLVQINDKFSYILLGFFAAILGNISAVGGGIIFIPAMMFIYKLPPLVALKVALLSQSFGMTSGAIAWMQRGTVPLNALKYCIPPLILGSIVSTFIIHPNGLFVKLLFGPVSILLGLITIITIRFKSKKDELKVIPEKAYWPMAGAAFFGGLITGWIAIGEGEIVAALLMLAFGVSSEICIGLGVVLLSVNSLFLTASHQFFLEGMPWEIGLFTGVGTVFGARFAGYISRYFSSNKLKIIFATIAITDGLLFIFQYMMKP